MKGERREAAETTGWRVFRPNGPDAEIVKRRFGRDHERPCNRPGVLTCALPKCQYANECRSHPLGDGE